MVPMIDLAAQHAPLRDEILEALARVVDSGQFALGEEVERFEASVSELTGVRHALGISSGTDALLVSLMALDVGPGDEVVTTAFSFFANGGAVTRLGARPVFVDIDEDTFNIDPAGVAGAITERTKAIVPVHLYGQLAAMDEVMNAGHGIPVVEDAAQALGADRVGSWGVVSTFSFYPTKNLSAMGEAGLVVTPDDGVAERLRRLRVHGAETTYIHDEVGGNFRMDAFQAAVLNVKVKHLSRWTEKRRAVAKRYRDLFEAQSLEARGVRPLAERSEHVYHQFVVRFQDRDRLREHLRSEGVATGVYYPVALPHQPCFAELGYVEGDFPVAERAAREGLALPIYPELTDDQQERVVNAIASFF